MAELSTNDYKKILEYYKNPIPKSKRLLKLEAEKIVADKLCKCIKKIDPELKNEGRAIGICTKTIINDKGFSRGKFTCKKNRKIQLKKRATTLKNSGKYRK